MIKTVLSTVAILAILLLPGLLAEGQGGPEDYAARARLRTEQAFREKRMSEMKEAADELAALTETLVKEVAAADSYTTSARLIQSSRRIEELAKEIGNLAKTVRNRAQGN